MKQLLCIMFTVLMTLSLVACGGDAPETPTETTVETPVATPETNEPNVEIPLPAWIEKREDGFCYLLPDAIEGIDDIIKPSVMFYYYIDYATTSHIPTQYVPFSSLTQMQDVLLYSLPTYYYKGHLGNLQGDDYKLGFDPRNLMAPVIPSSLEYERVEVTASAGGYNICWMSKDNVYWDPPFIVVF